jgi:hypothetical protein
MIAYMRYLVIAAEELDSHPETAKYPGQNSAAVIQDVVVGQA